MHTSPLPHSLETRTSERVAAVLRAAKLLHRRAVTDSRMQSLPVLRRLLSSQVLHGISLPQLFERKAIVQRKHVLQMLAIEAGLSDWSTYRDVLASNAEHVHLPLEVAALHAGYPNHWFSTLEQARSYAALRGGEVVRVGMQAVVLPVLATTPSGR